MLPCKKHCPRLARQYTSSERCWSLRLYPNPAREYIIVEYKVQDTDLPAVIKVIDSKGSVVGQYRITDVEGQMLYETKGINSGLYCFTLVTRMNAVVSKKVSVLK